MKNTTRGKQVWLVKSGRVQLVAKDESGRSYPTDRRYWLIVAKNEKSGEIKYIVSNASAKTEILDIIRAAFARWRVEKWFERGKQLAGFGSFEVRKYVGLTRHWLCSRLAMYFLNCQTKRFRGEKSPDHIRAGSPSGNDVVEKTSELFSEDVA